MASPANAEGWKVRAREHFEQHSYKVDALDRSLKFKGLTNTINIWHERPFHYSLGLALGPVIGKASVVSGSESQELGSTLKLWVVGLEGKYFPVGPEWKGFLRLGLSWHSLNTNGSYGDLEGWGYYGGVGWEFPIGPVSIAPEIAVREVLLNGGVRGTVFTPSIGFHFYPELRKN